MSLPVPTVGSQNVRGFVLPATCAGSVCALPSLYGNGNYPADQFNPLVFYTSEDLSGFAVGAEVLFDVVAVYGNRIGAANVRAA